MKLRYNRKLEHSACGAPMGVPLGLSVSRAQAEDRAVVGNLLQLYLHDSSEYQDGAGIGADGLFAYPHFDSYWCGDPARSVHILRVEGALAGFAFVNDWSPSGQGVDHGLAEFFVLRAHRRSGVGWEAASRLFEALPGVWEVAVSGPNVPAVNFWRTALRADPISDLKESAGDGTRWTGTIFRFSSAANTV